MGHASPWQAKCAFPAMACSGCKKCNAGDAGPRTAPHSNIPVHVLEVWAPVLKEWFGYSLYACTFTGNEFVWDSRAAGKINSIAFKQEWDRAVAVLNDADINSGPA